MSTVPTHARLCRGYQDNNGESRSSTSQNHEGKRLGKKITVVMTITLKRNKVRKSVKYRGEDRSTGASRRGGTATQQRQGRRMQAMTARTRDCRGEEVRSPLLGPSDAFWEREIHKFPITHLSSVPQTFLDGLHWY